MKFDVKVWVTFTPSEQDFFSFLFFLSPSFACFTLTESFAFNLLLYRFCAHSKLHCTFSWLQQWDTRWTLSLFFCTFLFSPCAHLSANSLLARDISLCHLFATSYSISFSRWSRVISSYWWTNGAIAIKSQVNHVLTWWTWTLTDIHDNC